MEKQKRITFSNDQKNLIWKRFVEPANGTQPELLQFIEICETFGLNPLLGDIVFQAYGEGAKRRVSFITTRDALLRIASHQEGYAGPPNSGVVREGDIFKFLPSEGKVHHEFGQKRGKILGAYAVLNHKVHNPVATFVDFEEYYNANSGVKNSRYGNPNVWDKLPSAMIVKVAEVFVLRRQFPLGGLHTFEEMSLDNMNDGLGHGNHEQNTSPVQQVQQNVQQAQQSGQKQEKQNSKPISFEETKKEKESKVNPAPMEQTQQAQEQKIKHEQNTKQNGQNDQSLQPNNNNLKPFTLERIEVGESPSGTEYARIFAVEVETGERVGVLTQDVSKVTPIRNLEQGATFLMSTYIKNSFMFLEQVAVLNKRTA